MSSKAASEKNMSPDSVRNDQPPKMPRLARCSARTVAIIATIVLLLGHVTSMTLAGLALADAERSEETQAGSASNAGATVSSILIVAIVMYGIGLIFNFLGLYAHVKGSASLIKAHLCFYLILIVVGILAATAVGATSSDVSINGAMANIGVNILFTAIQHVHYKYCRAAESYESEKY